MGPGEFEIGVRGYRCFTERVSFQFRPGLTAIVGPNNAGKSTLFRLLYEFRRIFSHMGQVDRLANALNQQIQFSGLVDDLTLDNVFSRKRGMRSQEIEIDFKCEGYDAAKITHINLRITFDEHLVVRAQMATSAGTVVSSGHKFVVNGGYIVETHRSQSFDVGEMIACLQAASQALYIPAFRHVVGGVGSADQNAMYYDMVVGSAFISKWRSAQSGNDAAARDRIENVEAEIARILGYTSCSVLPSDDGRSLILRTNEGSFRLDEVGAGISQFVLVLGTAALAQPTFILIDEPETGLHPALQSGFLLVLAHYSSRGVMFSTHSPHLASSVAQWGYRCERSEGSGSAIAEWEPGHELPQQLVQVLSFANEGRRETHQILLVEGKTDILVWHQWLRLYDKASNIAILDLGGDNLCRDGEQQLALLGSCGIRVFAAVDSECESEESGPRKDRLKFKTSCEKYGIKCLLLERRSSECYLPQHAIDAAFGAGKFTEFGKYDVHAPPWSKHANHCIASKMHRSDLANTDIERFILDL